MDEKRFAKYFRLRRWYFGLMLGLVAFSILDPWLGQAAKAVLPAAVFGWVGRLLPIVLVAAVLGAMVTGFQLFFWPCPRCGRAFARSFWSRWPSIRCKHCGLDADPARTDLPFSRIAYEQQVESTAGSAMFTLADDDPTPRWRRIAAEILRTGAAVIGIVACLESVAAARWLIIQWQNRAEYKPLFPGIGLTLGQALLVGAMVEAAVAVLLWLMAGWIWRLKRPPPI